jgi:hypothetical protein
MEETKDFDSFYDTKVTPLLAKLVAEKKQSNKAIIVLIVFIVLTIASFAATLNGLLDPAGTMITIALLLITLYLIYDATKRNDRYIADFKQSVVTEVIHYLHPGLTYKPDELIPEKEYRQSGLFRKRYDYYYGDDYLEGIYKEVSFHCSKIETTYQTGRRNNEATIFKGLFFAAEVNPGYTGGTYVWINGNNQFGATIADERYRLLPFPEVYDMKMGDELFDKYFTVCSTNPVEARTILNSDMMYCLLEFRKQIKRKVVFSVVMGKCYVAIPIDEDLLEPTNTVGDKEDIKKYFFTILLILSIINQLQIKRLT